MSRRPNDPWLAPVRRIKMRVMTHGRRIIVLPADWSSTELARDPRRERSDDRALEETARALCRELQERAILAAIAHRK